MSHPHPFSRRIAPSVYAALCAAVAATPAFAQDATPNERSPYYFGVSQAFSHDSNLYRTASNEVSETISITSLLAGFDQPIGRQRLFADVEAQINRFHTVDSLNNKSFAVNAGMDWETVEFLSGALRYSARNSLADFGTLDGSTIPSDQISQQFLASARFGMTSKLSFNAAYEHRDLKYRADVYANRNYKQDAVSGGFRWGTADLLVFGLGYRATKGRTPEFQATPPYEDELDRRDIDFTTAWTPTGASTLNVRISSTKETHTLPSNNERSAVTGALAWDYRPTAKLSFTTAITRDTGTETTFLGIPPSGSTPLPVDQSSLSTTTQVQARYAMTSKVSMNGDIRYRRGTLTNGEEERLTGYGIALNYNPTRSVTLGCDVTYEDRDTVNITAYKATVSTCSAQFTLR